MLRILGLCSMLYRKCYPKLFIFDEEELLNRIIHSYWSEESEYKESYKAFKQRFHKYFDGNSL